MTIALRKISFDRIPPEILLEGDESEESIKGYRNSADCFGVFVDDEMVGACVTDAVGPDTSELFNIAVLPSHQKKGLGTRLLHFAIDALKQMGQSRIVLGTGSFGYQLAFYQRAGFRVDAVVKNYFIENCEHPIFENGIQLKDQLRLSLHLEG